MVHLIIKAVRLEVLFCFLKRSCYVEFRLALNCVAQAALELKVIFLPPGMPHHTQLRLNFKSISF